MKYIEEAKEFLKTRTKQRGDYLMITRYEAINALSDFAEEMKKRKIIKIEQIVLKNLQNP